MAADFTAAGMPVPAEPRQLDSAPGNGGTGLDGPALLSRPKAEDATADGPAKCRTVCVSKLLPLSMQREAWSFQDFDVSKQLYRGKLSIVYAAVDRQSGKQVVLKLYRKRKLSVLNWSQVEREIKLHIQLEHDNIIKLYSVFEDDKLVYLVQELAHGGDLFDALSQAGGRLTEKTAVQAVLVPTLQALTHLHSKNILHRDIKPENILLTGSLGRGIKLADFGMAINQQQERPVTRVGTLDYMAPEVLICPDKTAPQDNKHNPLIGYSTQVDSWAIGILAFELLVGFPPFENESRSKTYDNIMYKNPSFSKLPVELSPEAKSFITASLCKSVANRPSIPELSNHPWIMQHATGNPTPLPSERTSAPCRTSGTATLHSISGTHNTPGPSSATAAASTSYMSDPECLSPDTSRLNPRPQMPVPPSTPSHTCTSPRASAHGPAQLGQGGRRVASPPASASRSSGSGRLHIPSLLGRQVPAASLSSPSEPTLSPPPLKGLDAELGAASGLEDFDSTAVSSPPSKAHGLAAATATDATAAAQQAGSGDRSNSPLGVAVAAANAGAGSIYPARPSGGSGTIQPWYVRKKSTTSGGGLSPAGVSGTGALGAAVGALALAGPAGAAMRGSSRGSQASSEDVPLHASGSRPGSSRHEDSRSSAIGAAGAGPGGREGGACDSPSRPVSRQLPPQQLCDRGMATGSPARSSSGRLPASLKVDIPQPDEGLATCFPTASAPGGPTPSTPFAMYSQGGKCTSPSPRSSLGGLPKPIPCNSPSPSAYAPASQFLESSPLETLGVGGEAPMVSSSNSHLPGSTSSCQPRGDSGVLGQGGHRLAASFTRQASVGLPLSPSSRSGKGLALSSRPGHMATAGLTDDPTPRSCSTPGGPPGGNASSPSASYAAPFGSDGGVADSRFSSPARSSCGSLKLRSPLHASQDSPLSAALTAAVKELRTNGSFGSLSSRTRSTPGTSPSASLGPGPHASVGAGPSPCTPGRTSGPGSRSVGGMGGLPVSISPASTMSRSSSRLGLDNGASRLSNAGTSPFASEPGNGSARSFPKHANSAPSFPRAPSRIHDGRSTVQMLRDDSMDGVERQDSLTLDFNPPVGIPAAEPNAKGSVRRPGADGGGIVGGGGGGSRVAALRQRGEDSGGHSFVSRQHSDGLLLQVLPPEGEPCGRRSISGAKQTGESKIAQGAVVSKIAEYVRGHV